MQLKDLAKTSEASQKLLSIFKEISALDSLNDIARQTDLLKDVTSSYSKEILIAAISQGVFSQEQIRAILQAKGLTEAEIEEIIATNALTTSQAGTTASTLGLGTAFKGLGLAIKKATADMLTWMASNPVGWITTVAAAIGVATYGIIKLRNAEAASLEKQKDKLNETKDAYEDLKNELQELKTEIQNNNNTIKELRSTSSPTWMEQEELNRLREVTKELEKQRILKRDEQLQAAQNLYDENQKTFNQEFKNSGGSTSISDLKQQLSSGNIGVAQLNISDNVTDIVAALQYLNEEKEKLTDEGEIDEYDGYIKDLTESLKNKGSKYLSALSQYKQNILELASIRDLKQDEQDFYDYLSSMQKAIYEYYSPATWNNLEFDSIFDTEGIEKTKKELISMYKSGELSSAEMLEQFPKLNQAIKESEIIAGEGSDVYKEFFNEIAALAEKQADTVFTTLSISETIDQLNTRLKPAFDSLKSAYQDIFTDDGFAMNSINILSISDSIKSKLDDMAESGLSVDYSSFEDFVMVLNNTESTEQDVETAFDSLADSITHAALSGTEDFETMKAALEDLGVVNNEIIAFDALISNTEALKAAGLDLTNATYEQIQAFASEYVSAENLSQAINMLTQQKMLNALEEMDTSKEVFNMISLAEQAGMTSEVIVNLTELEKIYQEVAKGTLSEHMLSQKLKRAEELKQLIEAGITESGYTPKTDFNGAAKSAAKAGKEAGDAYVDAYKEELKELDRMHDMGLISEKEYWQARMDLNEKYFGESSGMHQKYLEEYQNNEKEILDGIKNLWKDYYSDRKNDLKDLISYAEKLYDKEIDSLEDSIKKLEERRDTENKYWQAQIDDIAAETDALQDANDERERAINLQEKQYQLQKAMHQRTVLLYSESKGFYYSRDDDAVKNAKNDLDNAEHDNKIADLKKQQEELQKQLDIILETYDSQIEAIEKQIDSLKEIKSAWSEIVENQEFKELEERLKSIFGDDVKDKILSGNADFMNGIIAQYSDTSDMLRTIEDAALADIQNMIAQYGVLPESLMPIADAAADIHNALGVVDTSGFNANLDNAAEKVQSVTNALNTLSDDVSNYQIPAPNTDNFTASFAEDGDILTALRGFKERFKKLCDEIPVIWNTSLSEAFGAGEVNGELLSDGSACDTKYDYLFVPLLTALENCELNMEKKLKECLETFTAFQADLSGIIGVDGGSSEDSGISQSDISGGKGKASGGEKKSESGGSDTIVGAIMEGGRQIDQALNGKEDSWSASFITAKDSIHGTSAYIVDCIESMVEAIVSACSAAIEAINMLANADENNSNNPTPAPYIGIGHAHNDETAHVEGTARVMGDWAVQSNENRALVGEVGRELIVRDGKYFTVGDNGAEMFDIKKGDIVFNHEQTEALLKNGYISGRGKAYADGTVGGGRFITPDGQILRPIQPGDRIWELKKAFEPLLNRWLNGEKEILSNAVFDGQKQMEQWTKEITNNTAVNNISNNRNVQPVVHQNITLSCPNVTNNSGIEYIQKELGNLSLKAIQEPLRDY